MRILNKGLRFLPFLAVVFAGLYFVRTDRDLDLQPVSVLWLLGSLGVLLLVFLSKALIWHRLLLRFELEVHFKAAYVSFFKSILMKYIPGKIWMLVGRAHILSAAGHPLKRCSIVSSVMQLLSIISGLLIGISGVLWFRFSVMPAVLLYMLLFILCAALFFFSRPRIVPNLRRIRLPKTIQNLSGGSIPPLADIIMLSMLHWILMGLAFWIFFRSFLSEIGLHPLLLQALANNIGIVASFAPGGLGVREGVMIAYLSLGGISVATATGLSIAARLWFWLAEVCVFFIGWCLEKAYR